MANNNRSKVINISDYEEKNEIWNKLIDNIIKSSNETTKQKRTLLINLDNRKKNRNH